MSKQSIYNDSLCYYNGVNNQMNSNKNLRPNSLPKNIQYQKCNENKGSGGFYQQNENNNYYNQIDGINNNKSVNSITKDKNLSNRDNLHNSDNRNSFSKMHEYIDTINSNQSQIQRNQINFDFSNHHIGRRGNSDMIKNESKINPVHNRNQDQNPRSNNLSNNQNSKVNTLKEYQLNYVNKIPSHDSNKMNDISRSNISDSLYVNNNINPYITSYIRENAKNIQISHKNNYRDTTNMNNFNGYRNISDNRFSTLNSNIKNIPTKVVYAETNDFIKNSLTNDHSIKHNLKFPMADTKYKYDKSFKDHSENSSLILNNIRNINIQYDQQSAIKPDIEEYFSSKKISRNDHISDPNINQDNDPQEVSQILQFYENDNDLKSISNGDAKKFDYINSSTSKSIFIDNNLKNSQNGNESNHMNPYKNGLYENSLYQNIKNNSNIAKNSPKPVACKQTNEVINNIKIFRSDLISKSYSPDVNDYVKIEDINIDENHLKNYYKELAEVYEKEFKNFYSKLKNLDFSNNEPSFNKVGSISSLENYIEYKFLDYLKENKPILELELLENNIFRWRNIAGDGNCFYRAVMFSYLEYILINDKDFLLLNLIKEIKEFTMQDISYNLFKSNKIDTNFLIYSLFFIIYIHDKNSGVMSDLSKYDLFIKLINNCKSIDLGLVCYLRIKIYKFLELNKSKIFSKDFNVKMGNLLSEKYEGDGEHFMWEEFYKENLLKLYSEAENIIIYVTPLILRINIKILTYDIGNEDSNKFRFIHCGLENKHTAFVFYRKIHYDLIYSKEYFEKIQNSLVSYFDLNNSKINIDNLKKQLKQHLGQLEENKNIRKYSKEGNSNINVINNNDNSGQEQVVNNPKKIDIENKDYDCSKNNSGFNLFELDEKKLNNTLTGVNQFNEKKMQEKEESKLSKKNKFIDLRHDDSLYSFNDKNMSPSQKEHKAIDILNNLKSLENSLDPNLNVTNKIENLYPEINYPNFNQNLNENNHKIPNNIVYPQLKEVNQQIAYQDSTDMIKCYFCGNQRCQKIFSFFKKNLCRECFMRDLSSEVFTEKQRIMSDSIDVLAENKFIFFDHIFQIKNDDQMEIYDKKIKYKDIETYFDIKFQEIIRKFRTENCLVCLSEDSKECQPKEIIVLPCCCTFYSVKHFIYFFNKLVFYNNREIHDNYFYCLCKKKYLVNEILKIFEILNTYKLDDQFFSLKKFLIDKFFHQTCFSCGVQLQKSKEENKFLVKDNNVCMMVHLTDFVHTSCQKCWKKFINFILEEKQRLGPKNMIKFYCSICEAEHLFLK